VGVFESELEAAEAYDAAVGAEWDAARRPRNFLLPGSEKKVGATGEEEAETAVAADTSVRMLTPAAQLLTKRVLEERKATAERAVAYNRRVAKGSSAANPAAGASPTKMKKSSSSAEVAAESKTATPAKKKASTSGGAAAGGGSKKKKGGGNDSDVEEVVNDDAAADDDDEGEEIEDCDDFDDFRSYDSRDSVSDASDLGSIDGRDRDEDKEAEDYGGKQDEEAYGAMELDDDEDEEEADDEDEDEDEDEEDGEQGSDGSDGDSDNEDWMPTAAKEAAYEPEGPICRLLRAVNESDFPPQRSEWSKYILELATGTNLIGVKPGQSGNFSRTKQVNQIDMASGAVLRLWDSVAAAARTLNIPAYQIANVLSNKTDTDNAGGFKWEYAMVANPSGENKAGDDDDEDDEDDFEEPDAKKEINWKAKIPTRSKEYRSGGSLRDYQTEGLSWLLRCWYTKRSSILADEMGLGKTVQVVTFLDHLYEVEGIKGPFLVCVPLSTIGHWKREFDGWSHMTCCIYHDVGGGRDMRDVIREYEWYYKGRSRRLLKFHVLITTYDDLQRDYEELAEVPWRCVVVDEAHRLRNTNSKLLECMRSVVTKGQISYGYQHRVLMTGTPLQNNTVELWSLLNFIEPAKFPDLEKFQSKFGTITTQDQVEHLQRRIAPHLLRRVKEDVAKDIPPKEETIIDVELTTMQKQYYRAIFEHNHGFLMQNLKGNMPKLMNIQMELRKCCNHPFLIAGVELTEMENLEKNIEDALATVSSSAARAKLMFDQKEFERRRMEEIMIPASGKMVLLDKLLPKLHKEGHKVNKTNLYYGS
jgi:hypothetical protein